MLPKPRAAVGIAGFKEVTVRGQVDLPAGFEGIS